MLEYSLTDDLFSNKTSVLKPEPLAIDYTGKKRYFSDFNKGSLARSKTFNGIAQAMANQWDF